VREQLVTQIMLGIVGGDLPRGARLPSTRELARRLKIHPNTVSAAFGELEERGWLDVRRGSGVYVRAPSAKTSAALNLDVEIAKLLRAGRESGHSLKTIQARLKYWSALRPPDKLLLIEPDEELAAIVVNEISEAVRLPVAHVSPEKLSKKISGAALMVLPSKVEQVREKLSPGTELLVLKINSVPKSLGQWMPARNDVIVGVVSRWRGFLESAHTMLLAAGFDDSAVLLRDGRQANWKRGLDSVAAVICDSLTAKKLPKAYRAIVFPMVSPDSIQELTKLEHFIQR
jgi:DNA-binding transcriptional regulator YhcF (GntR family)